MYTSVKMKNTIILHEIHYYHWHCLYIQEHYYFGIIRITAGVVVAL